MTHELRIERMIDAGPVEVYEVFTAVEAMKEWYRDQPDWVVEVRADVRVGGTTTVRFGPGPERYREDMTYRVVDPPGRLLFDEVFTMPDGRSFDTVVEVTFEDREGKTLLTIVQSEFELESDRDDHEGGWPGFIDRLEAFVRRRPS